MSASSPTANTWPRWICVAILLGLYLSVHGYQSFDGDQAYRLPLLLHRQDPRLYADDPFVRAFDAFNPHRGYLALLDLASRPLGLSAALAIVYGLTCLVTFLGIDRLARASWPERGQGVGVVAIGLVLLARAGNIGTNHLFEGTLLDRLIGFGLGWLALSGAVGRSGPRAWLSAVWIGLAAVIHPSVGLQLAMVWSASWLAWALASRVSEVRPREAVLACLAMAVAMVPAAVLHAGGGSTLFEGLPAEEFRLLAAYVQGPQHMIPHLWRGSQVAAWGCYVLLAALALREMPVGNSPRGRWRAAIVLGLTLLGLIAGWAAIEWVGDLRATLFQPFRMATVARGLCLVLLAGRVDRLWRRGDLAGRLRAALLAAGLAGDRAMIVATAVEVVFAVGAGLPVGLGVVGVGLAVLARHDTESGHWLLLGGLAAAMLVSCPPFRRRHPAVSMPCPRRSKRRLAFALTSAWALPVLGLIATFTPPGAPRWLRVGADALVARCRFAARPGDDAERLAEWCRGHTPATARFVVPPGLKAFRLWSRRAVAFNRAASPYHAAGLADWAARFRDHVGFRGTTTEFARAYLADRYALERRYKAMSPADRAALARRQGASYLVAAAPGPGAAATSRDALELLHVEGRLAVFALVPTGAKATAPRVAATGP